MPSYTQTRLRIPFLDYSLKILQKKGKTSDIFLDSQRETLSAYLFIIASEVLCVNVRNSNDICGINGDNEQIKSESVCR